MQRNVGHGGLHKQAIRCIQLHTRIAGPKLDCKSYDLRYYLCSTCEHYEVIQDKFGVKKIEKYLFCSFEQNHVWVFSFTPDL